MSRKEKDRAKEGARFTRIAVVVAFLGAAFMLLVATNLGLRYGVSWSFDPKHNSDIAVFIGSIAGALFTLTNALLLFATLQAQRKAQSDTNLQHRELRQDRNYDQLNAMTDNLELNIEAYTLTEEPSGSQTGEGHQRLTGYAALLRTFELWPKQCVFLPLEPFAKEDFRFRPDMYLSNQTQVTDLIFKLQGLMEGIKAGDLDRRRLEYLSVRANRMLTRLSQGKQDVMRAARELRTIVERGGGNVPKYYYDSELLHLERVIRSIADVMEDIPYRRLSPFDQVRVTLSKDHPIAMFESVSLPSIQVDGVHFKSEDSAWALRFNKGQLTVQVEALDQQAKQLKYQFQQFGFAVLLYEAKQIGQTFDTNGLWFVEGSYNLIGGHIEDHKRWRIDVGLKDMELLEGESLELTITTNGRQIQEAEPIKRAFG